MTAQVRFKLLLKVYNRSWLTDESSESSSYSFKRKQVCLSNLKYEFSSKVELSFYIFVVYSECKGRTEDSGYMERF